MAYFRAILRRLEHLGDFVELPRREAQEERAAAPRVEELGLKALATEEAADQLVGVE
jgi:hypothetical protein